MHLEMYAIRGSASVVCLLLLLPATGCGTENRTHDGPSGQANGGASAGAGGGMAETSGCASAEAGSPSAEVIGGGGREGTVRALDRSVPADGWRWESSLGIEVAVPNDWTINDTDCDQTDAPSVVRSQGLVWNCFTPEPATKQIVEIADALTAQNLERPVPLTYRDVMIGSTAAERGEGEIGDGRAAGWVHVPSIGVIVDVRVKNEETLHMVLDSIRVIDTDHNLCLTSRKDMGPVAPKADTLAPGQAHAVSVCYFDRKDVLQASTLIEGVEAQDLVDNLNAAQSGRNADPPENICLRESDVPPPDAVLLIHGDNDYAQIEMTFSTCLHRGLSNGRSEAGLTTKVLTATMGPLWVAYHYLPLPD